MTEFPERIREVEIDSFADPAGTLSQPAEFVFQYRPEAGHWCSLTMPVRNTPYRYGTLHPVFAQNLPEGYVRRYIAGRLERYAEVNDLYLLALQQDTSIGHIAIRSIIGRAEAEQLSLDDILHWQGAEPIFAQLLDRYYLRGMLSGVQPKVMVPVEGHSTIAQQDLIIKTFDREYDLLTVNEFVCMSAAERVGLNPPRFWLSDDLRSFVIERFDCRDGEQLAFEDFTVLTGQNKYRGSYETLLQAVADYTRSPDQLFAAYRLIVFNCLIGNGDAHLKNFALQYSADRREITLTPPYDITHTLIYPTIDNRMALKMDRARSFPQRRTLVKLGERFGIRHGDKVIDEMADLLSDFIRECELIDRIPGFRDSLYRAVSVASTRNFVTTPRRDRNRKYP